MNTDPIRLAVIGTAGRKDDRDRLTKETYVTMRARVLDMMELLKSHRGGVGMLVSGGAAYADHCAVSIFNAGKVPMLALYLPDMWDDFQFFDARTRGGKDSGGVANYYHRLFSEKVGIHSLGQLAIAMKSQSCHTVTCTDFLARNRKVAENCDELLAMTYGDGPDVKPGGTAHTVATFRHMQPTAPAYHLDLNTMKVWNIQTRELVLDAPAS